MNPAHRDWVAFIRVYAGRFVRGMWLTNCRSGKTMRARNVVAFLSQRRELVDEAYAGDIIGIPNHGIFRLGDGVTDGESLQFWQLPCFAPEIFKVVLVRDPLRRKQLRTGLAHLAEEGAIQVFHAHLGGELVLGAVGPLQFDVVAHRLADEYGVPVRFIGTRYVSARWVMGRDSRETQRFIEAHAARVAYDRTDAPVFLATSEADLALTQAQWPTVVFHSMRNYSDGTPQTAQSEVMPENLDH